MKYALPVVTVIMWILIAICIFGAIRGCLKTPNPNYYRGPQIYEISSRM